MDRIAKALMNHDEVYADISNVLFGDGAEELISKLSSQEKKQKKTKALQNIAIGTNAVGSVAGPAAIGLAARSASKKEGGMPRQFGNIAGEKAHKIKSPHLKATATRMGRGADWVKGNKKAAVASGAALVGLQGINWGGDILSAKLIGDQKKKDIAASKVKKDSPDGADLHVAGGMRAKPVKVALNESLPVLSAKANLATAKGKKKLGESAKAGREKFEDVKANLKKADEVDVKWEGEIAKFDEDKRQVFGYASVVEVNGEPVIDKQGDYISIDEVEKSAYDYVQKSRKGGNMHKRNGEEAHHVSDMIESFVITPEKIEKMGLPESTPVGWWIGFQVNDEDTWDEVKKGDLSGFSIHGRGSRTDGTI